MRTLIFLLCCTVLAACGPTGQTGDRYRYRYPAAKVSSAKTVKFASTDGRFVGLSDGSLWNIDWSNASAARAFRPGQPVKVEHLGGGGFPYQLTTPGARPVRARFGKKLD